MTLPYDQYYQTPNLFGDPYPELIAFFRQFPEKGKVLDLGCGQGRDAIALARLGFAVTGIDHSKVGIDQMMHSAQPENLKLKGKVDDIYAFNQYEAFDFILLNSMFHFAKKDREKEMGLLKKIIAEVRKGCIVVICIQDTANKVVLLNQVLAFENQLKRLADKKFKYTFEDKESGHKSVTPYRLIAVEK